MARLLPTSLLAGLLVAGASSQIHPQPRQDTPLVEIAVSRPCLATAMLYVAMDPARSDSGVLWLDGIPTLDTVLTLTDETGARSAGLVTEHTPYSSAAYFVEIRWTISLLRPHTYFFTTRAQLIDNAGSPLVPAHVLEPVTTALVTGESIQLLQSPKTL